MHNSYHSLTFQLADISHTGKLGSHFWTSLSSILPVLQAYIYTCNRLPFSSKYDGKILCKLRMCLLHSGNLMISHHKFYMVVRWLLEGDPDSFLFVFSFSPTEYNNIYYTTPLTKSMTSQGSL